MIGLVYLFFKMFDVKEKIVLITGSSRGIGKAIAIQLAKSGSKVVISSRSKENCDHLAKELNDSGYQAISIPCHVGDKKQVKKLVKKTVDFFGGIDVLICNAATNPTYGKLLELNDQAFNKLMQVNVHSTIWLSKECVPYFSKSKGGSIIVLSSITAITGTSNIGAYGMSKAAEASIVRNLAYELGSKKIRVNAIAPGLIKTDFSQILWDNPNIIKKQKTKTPIRRIGLPKDIAGVAHFLSSEASEFITGQLIVVDGGETISWNQE